jgi:hypothetical protein
MAKSLKRGGGLQTRWHINPHVIKDAQEPEDISYKPVKTLGYNGTDAWTIQDGALETAGVYTMINNGALAGVPSFMGYMALAQLSQDGVIKRGGD